MISERVRGIAQTQPWPRLHASRNPLLKDKGTAAHLSLVQCTRACATAWQLPGSQSLLIKRLSGCILASQGGRQWLLCAHWKGSSALLTQAHSGTATSSFQGWLGESSPFHSVWLIASRIKAGKGWHSVCTLSPESLRHSAVLERPSAALPGGLPGWCPGLTGLYF